MQRTAPHNNFPPKMSMVPRLKTPYLKEKLPSLHLVAPWGKPWEEAMLQIADLRMEKTGSVTTPPGHRLILPLGIQLHKFHFLMVKPLFNWFGSVQSLSRVRLFATPWTAAGQASLSITNSRNPPKPMSIQSMMPSNHLILCRPLLLLPSIFPSIRVFSSESALCIRWPKYWSFSFSICPSSEHPGLISFRMDWLDLLVVQGALKSLLQYHSSKASILWRSAFFTVQLSHPYLTTTRKTIALTRWTFVGKVMSLLFKYAV